MEDSVYTRIIKGELPCHKIYEDDRVIALLDIHPVQPGMVLVIPKAQVANFYDLKAADSLALWEVVNRVAAEVAKEKKTSLKSKK